MRDLTRLPHRLDADDGTCRVIVETPRGARAKYDYNPETDLFELSKILPEGMRFPTDFGFVPSTLCDDGDPLDVMLLGDEPGAVGVLVRARLLGVLLVEQVKAGKTERNDRLLAVPWCSRLHASATRPRAISSPPSSTTSRSSGSTRPSSKARPSRSSAAAARPWRSSSCARPRRRRRPEANDLVAKLASAAT